MVIGAHCKLAACFTPPRLLCPPCRPPLACRPAFEAAKRQRPGPVQRASEESNTRTTRLRLEVSASPEPIKATQATSNDEHGLQRRSDAPLSSAERTRLTSRATTSMRRQRQRARRAGRQAAAYSLSRSMSMTFHPCFPPLIPLHIVVSAAPCLIAHIARIAHSFRHPNQATSFPPRYAQLCSADTRSACH